jgi:hypothetical protein
VQASNHKLNTAKRESFKHPRPFIAKSVCRSAIATRSETTNREFPLNVAATSSEKQKENYD